MNDAMVMALRGVSIVYQRYQLWEITESPIFRISGPTIVDNELNISHKRKPSAAVLVDFPSDLGTKQYGIVCIWIVQKVIEWFCGGHIPCSCIVAIS